MLKLVSRVVAPAVAAVAMVAVTPGASPAQAYVCGTNNTVLCGSVVNGRESLISIQVRHRSMYPPLVRSLAPNQSSRSAGITDAGIVDLKAGQCGRRRIMTSNGWSGWSDWYRGPAAVGAGRVDQYWNALNC